MLTVDAPLLGNRERDVHNKFTLPDGIEICNLTADGKLAVSSGGGSGLSEFVDEHLDPGLRWEHVEWLRSITDLPIVGKGICRPVDAVRSIDAGVNALVVSNHGGRQLDHGRGSIEVLPEVIAAVGGKASVLVDGSIMRGTDVIKALALGANAVCIGKLQGLGLAAAGKKGLVHLLKLLESEIRISMALLGLRNFTEIDSSFVEKVEPIIEPHVISPYTHIDIEELEYDR